MHPTLMLMFMDAQRADRQRHIRAGRPESRKRARHARDERR
jgi:hypothetical protein